MIKGGSKSATADLQPIRSGTKLFNSKTVSLSAIAVLLVLSLYGIFFAPVWGDEKYCHLPLAKNITIESIIRPDSDYSSAYTPLPYFIGKGTLLIWPSHYSLRMLNWILAVLCIIVFWKLAKKTTAHTELLTWLFACNPYFIRSAVFYYMFNYGLFFALAGLYFSFFSHQKHKVLFSHAAWGLSVLCMQWMLVVFFVVSVFEIKKSFHGNKPGFNRILNMIAVKMIALLPAFVIFCFWGYFTHPKYRAHGIHPSLTHLVAVFTVVGFVFCMYGLFKMIDFKNKSIYLLILLIPILFFIPQYSNQQGLGLVTGVPASFSLTLESILKIPYALSMAALSVLGIMVFGNACSGRNKSDFETAMLFTVIGLLLTHSFAKRLGASHVFISIPFWLLLFSDRLFEKKTTITLMIAQMYSVTIVYLLYLFQYKSGSVNWNDLLQ